MLEIKHLSYQVEGESGEELGILNDVSLTVADHQFVVITGPNGGGKTTLAKAIMGLVRPTGGTIAWNGTDITGLDITQRARLGVSYGFQQPPRFKGLRVRDLLALAGAACMAGHWLCSRYARRTVEALPYTYLVYGQTALLLALMAPLTGGFQLTPASLWYVLGLAAGSTLLGHLLFTVALGRVSATVVSFAIVASSRLSLPSRLRMSSSVS